METQNQPQTSSTQWMLPLNHPNRIQIAFDDHRLVANAGVPNRRQLVLPRVASNQMLPSFVRTRSLIGSSHEMGDGWPASSGNPTAIHWRLDLRTRHTDDPVLLIPVMVRPKIYYVKRILRGVSQPWPAIPPKKNTLVRSVPSPRRPIAVTLAPVWSLSSLRRRLHQHPRRASERIHLLLASAWRSAITPKWSDSFVSPSKLLITPKDPITRSWLNAI